ncbi:MAG: elongation factor P [Acidobacteria bacterium]|nr:MAG: elongation factor P [Acidobacteriota bacterium]REK00230.1 MAG: elongation factor P [Acidobacteriota bacterium]
MPSYNMNQLRNGLKLLIDRDPYLVVDTDMVKPGKGQAFTKVKVRNMLTGRVTEKTYKASDMAEGADVVETSMQYLYSDGENWIFMNPDTFDQVAANADAMGDTPQWIKEEDVCQITLFNGSPILVSPPNFVEREIVETDPGLKGDTSSGGNKPATLETGAVVRVPLFIQVGEMIKVDTRTGEYVSRVKS